MKDQAVEVIKKWLSNISCFSLLVTPQPLREYQLPAARAILQSVIFKRGLTFAVIFPRQSGNNEVQAQVEAYLLNLYQLRPGAQIVKASPTFKPQTQNSIRRVEGALDNQWNRHDVST